MSRLRDGNKALSTGRTIFLKTVKQPNEVKRILQPASTNSKLGGGKTIIERGRWRGMRLYQLVLEERRTCPKSCQQWASCYGNNMFLANRIDHRSSFFLSHLAKEISSLASRHPEGFVVRLHVLGDFYSKAYVRFWLRMTRKHPELHLFGYTHRWPGQGDGIGEEIEKLNAAGAWIRFSDRGGEMSANVAPSTGPDDIQCPQEVGKTKSCLTCGLCWQTPKPIKFLEH